MIVGVPADGVRAEAGRRERAAVVEAGLHRAWRQQVSWGPDGDVRSVDGLVLYRSGSDEPALSAAVATASSTDPATALAEVERILAADRLPLFCDIEVDRSPVLEEAAKARGLLPVERRLGMTLELADTSFRDDRRVEPVTDVEGFIQLRAIQATAFGMSSRLASAALPDMALHGPNGGFHLLFEDGRPLAAAMTVTAAEDGSVGLFGIATLPAARGRGLATALVSHLLARSAQAGFRVAWLLATAPSEPLYRRLGFTRVTQWRLWGPAPV